MRSTAATHLDFEPQVEEITDERQALRRASVELEAARARVERDAERIHDETRTRLVAELLPVLDNLDRAIAAGDGVRLVREQLAGVLRGYGLERFDAAGGGEDPEARPGEVLGAGGADAGGAARDEDAADQGALCAPACAGVRASARASRRA